MGMKNNKLHHIGIIFTSMEKAELFKQTLGLEEEYRGYVDSYQAWCIFLGPGESTKIELIIPTGGVLANYNNGKGGIHHIAYDVNDVEQIRKDFEKKGIILLEEKAVPGAGNIMVNFMRPRDGHGVLVEFVETLNSR